MENKTCGECRHFGDIYFKDPCAWAHSTHEACFEFEPTVELKGDETCGKCKWFVLDGSGFCRSNEGQEDSGNDACSFFEPKVITNGEAIIQGGNDALIDFADGIRRRMCHYCMYSKDESCVDKTGDCWCGVRAWLDAPAESEGKDE